MGDESNGNNNQGRSATQDTTPPDYAALFLAINNIQQTTNKIQQSTIEHQAATQANFTKLTDSINAEMKKQLDQLKSECIKRTEAIEAKVATLAARMESLENSEPIQQQLKEMAEMKEAMELLSESK